MDGMILLLVVPEKSHPRATSLSLRSSVHCTRHRRGPLHRCSCKSVEPPGSRAFESGPEERHCSAYRVARSWPGHLTFLILLSPSVTIRKLRIRGLYSQDLKLLRPTLPRVGRPRVLGGGYLCSPLTTGAVVAAGATLRSSS